MDDLKNIQFFNVYSNDLDESTYYDYDDDFYAIYEPFFICDCHGCIPFINGINNNFINISSICNNFEQEQHSIKEIFKIFVQPIKSIIENLIIIVIIVRNIYVKYVLKKVVYIWIII